MNYFKKVTGDRLYLSPMNPDDSQLYTKWLCDLTASIPLGNAVSTFSLPRERAAVESMAKKDNNFAIVTLEGDRLIGNGSIQDISHVHRRGEIGLFIGEDEDRNKGYGSEAVNLLLTFGFKVLNLHNIMLGVYSFNERAIRCYKKCGFREFGRRTESYRINNKYFDGIFMEILSRDFTCDYLNGILPE